ncbi:flagellar biosynthetic protein FlhB [Jatrophihabitans endophyticus]|uniref:Flagellar biosynthetic protein FlhB n=1 Tax=Jatrophihabitans endophyticus TaxID=1206085 RepID=A0A1M5III6_9ACTN|nr:EscU/YscU/HrcU family type III secretion system export apparatus switch protein [Jatrophihabitans endophyticus]SHG27583.1 flagellar biosynthetic protein FlhB [Jatrophihabitans endophyticus]
MSGGSGGEKSEKATPKRRKKARHDGQIGNTPELGAWLGMLAASFVIPHVAKSLMDTSTRGVVMIGSVIRAPDAGRAMAIASDAFHDGFMNALPMALLAAAVGVASVAGQGALWFAPGLLKPKFKRLNPLSGIKRMFGKHGAWTLVKSLLKTAALAVVVYASIRNLVPTLLGSGSLPLSELVSICIDSVMTMLRWAAVAGLLMALADFVVVRKRNDKQLKMTMQEVKDEFKSSEGDPHVRGQRRAAQMAMRRNRMMADVPTADVVVVNPTHVAVALRYDPQKGAPRVVAKGGDHVAARIRAVAEEHRVPMVADIPLARALHAACAVGEEIPPDLYRAVATVIAFIMTLRRRGSTAGVHTVRTLAPTG